MLTRPAGPLERAQNAAFEEGLRLRFESGRTNEVADDDIFEIVQDQVPTDPRVLAWMLAADPTLAEEPEEVWGNYHGVDNQDPEHVANLAASGTTPELQRVAANVAARLEGYVHSGYLGDMTAVDALNVVVTVSQNDGLRFRTMTTHELSARPRASALSAVGANTGPLRERP